MSTPLDGYKTYIVGAVAIGLLIFFYLRGEVSGPMALSMILGFLGLGGIGHKIDRQAGSKGGGDVQG
jgi:hypothetical protein